MPGVVSENILGTNSDGGFCAKLRVIPVSQEVIEESSSALCSITPNASLGEVATEENSTEYLPFFGEPGSEHDSGLVFGHSLPIFIHAPPFPDHVPGPTQHTARLSRQDRNLDHGGVIITTGEHVTLPSIT
jgi:hypothetical protein